MGFGIQLLERSPLLTTSLDEYLQGGIEGRSISEPDATRLIAFGGHVVSAATREGLEQITDEYDEEGDAAPPSPALRVAGDFVANEDYQWAPPKAGMQWQHTQVWAAERPYETDPDQTHEQQEVLSALEKFYGPIEDLAIVRERGFVSIRSETGILETVPVNWPSLIRSDWFEKVANRPKNWVSKEAKMASFALGLSLFDASGVGHPAFLKSVYRTYRKLGLTPPFDNPSKL
jgi:hypothetical protein